MGQAIKKVLLIPLLELTSEHRQGPLSYTIVLSLLPQEPAKDTSKLGNRGFSVPLSSFLFAVQLLKLKPDTRQAGLKIRRLAKEKLQPKSNVHTMARRTAVRNLHASPSATPPQGTNEQNPTKNPTKPSTPESAKRRAHRYVKLFEPRRLSSLTATQTNMEHLNVYRYYMSYSLIS